MATARRWPARTGRITAVEKVQVRGDGHNVAGVIGGAYAGNRIQRQASMEEVWRVSVRMSDGSTRTFDYANDPAVALGTPVRVQDGVLVRI